MWVMWNMMSAYRRLLPLGIVLSDIVADFELGFGQTGKHPLERRLSLAKRRGVSTLLVGQRLPHFGHHSGRNGRPFYFSFLLRAPQNFGPEVIARTISHQKQNRTRLLGSFDFNNQTLCPTAPA